MSILIFGSNLLIRLNLKATLSQFAQTWKAVRDAEDDEEEAILCEIDEPLDEEDLKALDGEDADHEASDAAMLADLEEELDGDDLDILVLSHDDAKLGWFAIHKVQ